MLQVQNLCYESKEGRKILKNISLKVERGEVVGLVGGSGAGKTSFFSFLFHDFLKTNLGKYKGKLVVDAKIQPIVQDVLSSFNPYLWMLYSLREPLLLAGWKKKDADLKIQESLGNFQLHGIDLRKFPRQYSGGQLQRFAILRAILARAGYLAMDEPVSGLDPINRNQVLDFLKSIQIRENLGILFISHDMEAVRRFCNRVYVLKDGEIVEEGRLPEFPTGNSHPYTKELFQPWNL